MDSIEEKEEPQEPVTKKRKLNEQRLDLDAESDIPHGSQPSRSRVKAPKADTEKKFRDACIDGSIKNFTVNEIKEFLKARDIPSNGIKTFLITLVKEYFDI